MRPLLFALMLAVAAVSAAAPYPPQSLYHLDAALTDQSGKARTLDMHRDHAVLITMFYGACPMACPLLIDSLRALENSMSAPQRSRTRVLMISIDPEHDTVQALHALAESRRLDLSRWTLARTDAATVRKIAALLNVQYRRLPDGGYNHSSVITLVTPQGEIAAQSTVLGKADPELLARLRSDW